MPLKGRADMCGAAVLTRDARQQVQSRSVKMEP
jgi:hypothetical protein